MWYKINELGILDVKFLYGYLIKIDVMILCDYFGVILEVES